MLAAIAALEVVPVAPATATCGFKRSIGAAVLAGQVSTVAAATLSYVLDVAAGLVIVIVAIAVFMGAKSLTWVRARDG